MTGAPALGGLLQSNGATAGSGVCPTTGSGRRWTLDGGDELVYRYRRKRLVRSGAPGAQLERDLCHRLFIGGLDDVDEVELAEHGPLCDYLGADLLDLLVHLFDPLRVVLHGLNTFRGETGKHDVCRHVAPSARLLAWG